MRIRKNAKLFPLLFSSITTTTQGGSGSGSVAVTIPTHVCQLNQSPWDVIPFDSDPIQFEVEYSGNNGSAGDSVESATSMMEDAELTEEKLKIEDMMLDDNRPGKKVVASYNGAARNACCQGLDEKGWPCKNRAKQGQSSLLCKHHLSLLRSYNNAVSAGCCGYSKKAPPSAAARGRRAATKKSSSENPYEFYYYSGFGPLWGKGRGIRNGEGSKNSVGGGEDSSMVELDDVIAGSEEVVDAAVDNNNNNVHDIVHGIDNGVFDYMDDDDDDDDGDDDNDGVKKRMMKPVKERSLKSLMRRCV